MHSDALVREALSAISLMGSHQYGLKSTAQNSEMLSEVHLLSLLNTSQALSKSHPREVVLRTAGQSGEQEDKRGVGYSVLLGISCRPHSPSFLRQSPTPQTTELINIYCGNCTNKWAVIIQFSSSLTDAISDSTL